MSLRLNPNLDMSKITVDFKSSKRVFIDDALETASAEAKFPSLRDYTAWELCYSSSDCKPARISNQELERMSTDELKELATMFTAEAHQATNICTSSFRPLPTLLYRAS